MIKDPQQETPICFCALCGVEIYRGERLWDSPLGLLCEECLDPADRQWLRELNADELQKGRGAL